MRGLQAVTVEEICAHADVSPRTFFRYFASKEDVVFPDDSERRAVMRDALAREMPGETLSAAIRRAVQALLDRDLVEDRHTARLRARLLADEPALARRLTYLTNEWTLELSDVVVRRLGDTDEPRVEARLAMGAMMGALTAAGEL